MSRRTFTPFALATVLATLLAAAASAQPPIPPASEPTPQSVPPTLLRIEATIPLELLPAAAAYQFGTVAAQNWYERPAEQVGAAVGAAIPLQAAQTTPPPQAVIRVAVPKLGDTPSAQPPVVCASAALPCCATKSVGLSGTWYREMPGAVVSVKFTGDELKVSLTGCDGGTAVTITLAADYSTTKDGTVHGVVTGIDVDVTGTNKLEAMELGELSMKLQELVDQPFAFRCRSTEGGLMLSNLRIGKEQEGCPELAVLLGMYKPTGCCGIPAPKPMKPAVQVATAAVALPCPQQVQAALVAEPPCPANLRDCVHPCPIPASPVLWTVPCPQPTNCPRPIVTCPPPMPPVVFTGPMPMPVFPPPQFYPGGPVPAGFVVPPPPLPAPMPRGIQGTWSREIGPAQCVFTFKNGQLTMTATMTGEEKGKSGTMGFLVTADYYPTRDGNGIVGVVTGVDVILEGQIAADSQHLNDVLRQIASLHKTLIGQPFSLSYRMQDDALMLSNLRIAVDKSDSLDEASSFVTGRFKPVGPNGVSMAKPLAAAECRSKVCAVEVIEIKRVEALPAMAPPTPLPQTGTVTPASGVQITPCEPCCPLPIFEGVRFGMMRDVNP